ncbi:hypothetical protein [Streptomyces sp. GD-15H]|uniref:hypothetical protein n=1 Tax=Streptomyces sp. GD-15H TaxID=3129112 RepID=UPI00387328F6
MRPPIRGLPQSLGRLDDGLSIARNVTRFAPTATNHRIRARPAHFREAGQAGSPKPFRAGRGSRRRCYRRTRCRRC